LIIVTPSRPKIKKISKNKEFFFKKKNQKTFAPLREVVARPLAKNYQSFFASFCSQKEVLSFFLLFKINFLFCGLRVTFFKERFSPKLSSRRNCAPQYLAQRLLRPGRARLRQQPAGTTSASHHSGKGCRQTRGLTVEVIGNRVLQRVAGIRQAHL
jgi:hypothetical protein